MCQNNTVCELFISHEERLKRFEAQLSSIYTLMTQLSSRLNQLQSQVDAIQQPLNSLRVNLNAHLGTSITIQTDAGSVIGVLLFVGDDFIEIQEPSGDLVFILITSVVGF